MKDSKKDVWSKPEEEKQPQTIFNVSPGATIKFVGGPQIKIQHQTWGK